MNKSIQNAAELIKSSNYCIAFTGAGISVESGIPPFRGDEGLWSKYDPEVLDINYFMANPDASWKVIMEIFYDFFGKAKPNAAHIGLAELEKKAILKAIITQNIDNLHQEAGSKVVWEYHGNYKYLVCPKCGKKYEASLETLKTIPPKCKKDMTVLKPDFVFFGEGIPVEASQGAFDDATKSDVIMVIGSTGEVMPANMIPRLAKQGGATVIEINTTHSSFTSGVTDIFLEGKAGDIISELVEIIMQ
jgi:NAD-dependent protein deacetylase/lipoamidase